MNSNQRKSRKKKNYLCTQMRDKVQREKIYKCLPSANKW